ncbi:MAG TPA: NAD(P)-binding protein [Pseudonocardiaceae bacterium]|nr:NAD(P)-binding protein [Pseudonocardiaceae bacterium]
MRGGGGIAISLHVLVAGGGVGGLCLAQGLRREGMPVSVFERDRSAQVRGRGIAFTLIRPASPRCAAVCPSRCSRSALRSRTGR